MPIDNLPKIDGQSEENEERRAHQGQSPSSFRKVSWFVVRADRDTGPTA